jgi:hypothetical protein
MRLTIYIAEHCSGCDRAQVLAAQMGQFFPELTVELIDLATELDNREEIFAVPTYMLNGRVVSLGNPKPDWLRDLIETEVTSSP